MVPPPKLSSTPNSQITAVPLTSESFSPFGTVISSPLPRDLAKIPSELHSQTSNYPPAVLANQSTALKYSPISPLQNGYTNHCPSGKEASARMSMFSCFPRQLRHEKKKGSLKYIARGKKEGDDHLFDVTILERHPYTTQTFIPLDLSSKRSIHPYRDTEQLEPIYLVVVSPSLSGQTAYAKGEDGSAVSVTDPPDLKNLKAFVARGGQAVTYGTGTWHAPMVVLGRRKVDFVVVQFVNGVEGEDCQEVTIGDGLVVDVDIDMGRTGLAGLWPGGVKRAKL